MSFAEVPTAALHRPSELPGLYSEPRWYAAWTRSRHEKTVAEQLERKQVETFLPLYNTVRQWKNGRHRVALPLFPGYAFVRIALRDRLEVLKVPGVVRLVGFNGLPAPLPDEQLEALRDGLSGRLEAEPHRYLVVGRRVRVVRRPLEGMEGFLVRKKGLLRLVLSISLIQRSVAVEVASADVEPI